MHEDSFLLYASPANTGKGPATWVHQFLGWLLLIRFPLLLILLDNDGDKTNLAENPGHTAIQASSSSPGKCKAIKYFWRHVHRLTWTLAAGVTTAVAVVDPVTVVVVA